MFDAVATHAQFASNIQPNYHLDLFSETVVSSVLTHPPRPPKNSTKKRHWAIGCSVAESATIPSTNAPALTRNFLEYPTDIVLLVVLWRLRYKLSLRDLAEIFLERGFVFTHEAVRDWEARFAPLIADQLRKKRHGQAGTSWHVDAHVCESARELVLPLSCH